MKRLITMVFAFTILNSSFSIAVAATAPVSETGLMTSYAAGDDGNLQPGVAWPNPRFVDNGNGTVTDNLTGLIWLKNANCFSAQQWTAALSSANGLSNGQCGLSDSSKTGDWRLPNVDELESLVDLSSYGLSLSLGHPFTSVKYDIYWSSSTVAVSTASTWVVIMVGGDVVGYDKVGNHYVWPVRGGQAMVSDSLTLSVAKTGTGSGTITSSTAGINCGATCSASITTGTSVTLTATPDSGSSFTGWSGACSGTGTCSVTVDAAKSVTATFALAPIIQNWSINSGNTANGTVNCTTSVNNGASSTCTVTPATGYQLSTFTDNSVDKKASVVGNSYIIINVTTNHTIVAIFSLTPTPVNGSCGTSTGGTFTVAPTTNFCTSGTASAVTGSGPWSWTCAGTNVGTTATCSATTPDDTTTKAKVYLAAGGDRYIVSNSGTTVYGNMGYDVVTIAVGVTSVILDQNIERINLSGASSSYKFKQTGNMINVYDTADNLIVKVPVQGDADGTILSFGNQGTASAKLSGGVMKLGDATVSSSVATVLTPTLTPL